MDCQTDYKERCEKIGPFFYIRNTLIYNACTLSEGRMQADKLDNSFGHEALYDKYFRFGDYIDYPRGRVVWDCSANRAIIYIDPCIKKPGIIEKIKNAFCITGYILAEDEHYHCRNCLTDIWTN